MSGLKHLLLGATATLLATTPAVLALEKIIVGQTFLASSTNATDGSAGWALTSHGVAEKLFTVNKDDEIVPAVAASVEKISDLVWELTLKSDYKFSDGTAVNAKHVADCLNELNEKNSNAQSSLGKLTATPLGELDAKGTATIGLDTKKEDVADEDLVLRIESERPTHVMDAVLAEWVFVVYLKDGNDFLYTGPYMIKDFSETEIDLIPNPYYERALERPEIVIRAATDGHDLAKDLEAREIDIGFHLPIDTLPELRKAEGVRIKSFEVGYHYMAFHNLDTLKDVKVRRAIDLAINRNALSQALAGGTPTRSLFPDYSPYYSDDGDQDGDSDAAAALLNEAGWTLDESSGMRTNKDGETLAIHAVTYPHRPGLGIMLPVIEDSLKALGIDATTMVTGDEWDETKKIIDGRTFDILLWAQHTLPAGDPLWFLSAFFRSDGGNNHANFDSKTVDNLLDDLSAADHNKRVAAAEKAHLAILEQVPVSNLVTPYWHVGLSDRMADYEPWGSDYYVIRSDLFISESAVTDEGEGGVEESTGSDGNGAFIMREASVLLFASVGAFLAF